MPIYGQGKLSRPCEPGDESHLTNWEAVSACRAFCSKASRSGHGTSLSASSRQALAFWSKKSLKDVASVELSRIMAHSRLPWPVIFLSEPGKLPQNTYLQPMFKSFDFCLPTKFTIVPHGPDDALMHDDQH
jgi:hypothetical protein